MTEREYHIDGLNFAYETLKKFVMQSESIESATPRIANALENISKASDFLREEQAAFDVLFVRDE